MQKSKEYQIALQEAVLKNFNRKDSYFPNLMENNLEKFYNTKFKKCNAAMISNVITPTKNLNEHSTPVFHF